MNIFFLSPDPQKNAEFICDVHLWSQLTNCLQVLSTDYRLIMGPVYDMYATDNMLYTRLAIYDPIVVWARKSFSHYLWLSQYCEALIVELEYRFKALSFQKEKHIIQSIFDHHIWIRTKLPGKNPIQFPKHNVPPEFVIESDVFAMHQYWFIQHMFFVRSWTKRPIPDWFEIISGIKDGVIPRSRLKRFTPIITQNFDLKRQRTEDMRDMLEAIKLLTIHDLPVM